VASATHEDLYTPSAPQVIFDCLFVFFFQAEDGIRDRNVTGVQTCALPIFMLWALLGWQIAFVYFIVLSIFSIIAGLVFSKLNLAETYKGVTVKGDGFFS